jgi:hypothetical protein
VKKNLLILITILLASTCCLFGQSVSILDKCYIGMPIKEFKVLADGKAILEEMDVSRTVYRFESTSPSIGNKKNIRFLYFDSNSKLERIDGGDYGKPTNYSDKPNNYSSGGYGISDTPISLRRFTNLVTPNDDGSKTGKIAVRVSINKEGLVVNAVPGVKGTTLNDRDLWQRCKEALMASRLDQSFNASDVQVGVVIFNFRGK